MNECPVGYLTRESEQAVTLFCACRWLHVPPLQAGMLDWPARLADTFLTLEQEAQKSDG